MDVKGDVIAFLNTSLTQPASLMVGRFKSKAENIGDIAKTTITTPMKIDELKGIMYEPHEYIYNNDDSISKWLALFLCDFSYNYLKKLYLCIYVIFRAI